MPASATSCWPPVPSLWAAGTFRWAGAIRLRPKVAVVQLAAGILFGIGDLALLSLVARVGTGVGFTIAQLSLLVNAGIGMWVFKVPKPGSHVSRSVLVGILVAGSGGVLIGILR
jgi:glucose uptake protein GlcU